jgi:uncharacterized protein
MKLIDLNILIYAINTDAPHHRMAYRFLEDCLSGEDPVGLAWVVILGFLRISTSARVMPKPLTAEQSYSLIDEWLSLPSVRVVTPTERHWAIFKEIGTKLGTAGNLTTDVHLAVLAIESGATLYSADNDFARIAGLRWKNPLIEKR